MTKNSVRIWVPVVSCLMCAIVMTTVLTLFRLYGLVTDDKAWLNVLIGCWFLFVGLAIVFYVCHMRESHRNIEKED